MFYTCDSHRRCSFLFPENALLLDDEMALDGVVSSMTFDALLVMGVVRSIAAVREFVFLIDELHRWPQRSGPFGM
jgi:hypothetical protein